MKLANKVALVTGSSQGIGRAIALRLAQDGADVVIHGRQQDERAEHSAEQVRATGRRACIITTDLAQTGNCQRLMREAIEQMGQVDILVNNAGMEKRACFQDVSEEDYDRVMSVNLKAAFFLSQAFVRHLQQRGFGGSIINTSSVHEELPFPHFASYCTSKGGLKMLMRNLAVELAPLGVRVNNVAPGAIETPINSELFKQPDKLAALKHNIPLQRLGQPRDVAGAVAFLASDEADYITGSTLFVDGGLLWNYREQ